MPLYVVVFCSRNKDNKGLKDFKQRHQSYLIRTNNLWDGHNVEDLEIYEKIRIKFNEFVKDGVCDELCRYYVSINPRNESKIKKALLLHLIVNNNYDIVDMNRIVTSIAMKQENADKRMWLIDYDTNDNLGEFMHDISSYDTAEDFVSLYATPHGYHFITAHGFDYCEPHTRDFNHELGEQNSQRI